MMKPPVDLHYEDRAVPQLLAGVLYQVLWTARQWVLLEEDEVLVVEGDEDFVTAIMEGGEVVAISHEQIKLLAGRLTARTPAVYETIFAFLCSFQLLTLEGKRCSFVLTTNSTLGAQHVSRKHSEDVASDLGIDVLRAWCDPSPRDEERTTSLIVSVKKLVAQYADGSVPDRMSGAKGREPSITAARVRSALAYLDEQPERWSQFLDCITFKVDSGDPRKVFETLELLLSEDARALGTDPKHLAYRVVLQTLWVGSNYDLVARHLRREDFDRLIQTSKADLVQWMRDTHPERLWGLDLLTDLRARVELLEGSAVGMTVSAEVRAKHREAVEKQNATFRVLGVDEDIAIDDSFRLTARWHDSSQNPFHAHRLLEGSASATVLVGDGGAGKSTVLRRIAWEAAKQDMLAMRVRATMLVALAEDSVPFGPALRRAIAEQSGLTVPEAAQVERALQVIVVDGLDEAGEQAEEIAASFAEYLATRPGLKAVLGTRPSHVGAVPKASFTRADLLPLEADERSAAVVQLLRACGESEDDAWTAATQLDLVLERTNFDSLPLHVTMALHLARSGETMTPSLSSLYDRALSSLGKRALQDRSVANVDRVYLARVLDTLGWEQTSRPGAGALDVDALTHQVEGARGLEQSARVEKALVVWEGRSIVRRTRVGGRERFEFAHVSLREFVSAQHLTRLAPEERRSWMAAHHGDDIIRFAVGFGGEGVLADYWVARPPSSVRALVMCASASRELAVPSSLYAARLAAAAVPFLGSNVPRTVARVAMAIAPLAELAPSEFLAAADSAFAARGAWNTFAAWLLVVRTRRALDDPNALREFLAKGATNRQLVRDAMVWELWNELVEPALDALITAGEVSGIDELLEAFVLQEDANISVGSHGRIVARLDGWGRSGIGERYRVKEEGFAREWFAALRQRSSSADQAFLELVATTFAADADEDVDAGLPNLSALLHAFDFYNEASNDWNAVFFTRGSCIAADLLRGAARAARCSPLTLSSEARYLLSRPPAVATTMGSAGIRKLGTGLPLRPTWDGDTALGLSVAHLAVALSWPAPYARVALMLLYVHADRDSVAATLLKSLEDGVTYVVAAVDMVLPRLGVDGPATLARILEQPRKETAPLLSVLANLEPSSQRTINCVISALSDDCGTVVAVAASVASRLPRSDALSGALRASLQRWRQWAGGDGPLEERADGLVECGTTLFARDVVTKQIAALVAHEALSYEALVQLGEVGPGADDAVRALADLSSRDAELHEKLVSDVASGRVAASGAQLLFGLKQPPVGDHGNLLALCRHEQEAIRRASVRGLRRCGWLTTAAKQRLLEQALGDSDVAVRDEAQQALDELTEA